MRNNNENLVNEIANLLKGVDFKNIDDVIARAKQEANIEMSKGKKHKHQEWFDHQIATFEAKGLPKKLLSVVKSKKEEVVSTAASMYIPEDNIPFLPIITQRSLNIQRLMSLAAHNNGVSSCINLNLEGIISITPPADIYFIYDIDDGENTLGESPEKSKREIKQRGKLPLTIEELLSLFTHCKIPIKNLVYCSSYRKYHKGGLLFMCLKQEEIELNCSGNQGIKYFALPERTPSCRLRR